MDERRVCGETQEFHGLRQQQHRGRCEQHRVRQSDDGADRAGIAGWLVGIVIGRRLRLGSFAGRMRYENNAGVSKRRLRRLELTRGRGLRGDGVEMTERQRELNGERKQREPRPMFDVRPEPLHADKRLAPEGRDIPAVPTLQYNIARFARGCQP